MLYYSIAELVLSVAVFISCFSAVKKALFLGSELQ